MKNKLIILSLAPSFLLTFIKNHSFISIDSKGETLTTTQFIEENIYVLSVEFFCLVWLVCSLIVLIEFKFFLKYRLASGYEIIEVEEDKEAGLNFFLALILPLMVDGLNSWQNFLSFAIIVIFIFLLLRKTDLFYVNPVLIVLGYRCYKITFSDNPYYRERCCGVSKDKLKSGMYVKYKQIEGNVLYLKEQGRIS